MTHVKSDDSPEAYRAWIKNVSDVLTVLDDSCRIVYESPAGVRVLGIESSQRVGTDFFAGIHPEDTPRVREILAAALATPGLPLSVELRHRKSDGAWRDLETVGQASNDPAGNLRLFVISRDITERKRAQAERSRREEQQRSAQKMEAIGRLAGGIAHEYNNLLTAILGHTDLGLASLPAGHTVRRNLEKVKHAAQRASALTCQLLAFGGRQILRPRVLSLNDVIRSTAAMLRPLIGEDIHLTLDLDAALGPVNSDAGQIEQVLMNLALNARDAMPRGGSFVIATGHTELDSAVAQRLGVPPGSYIQMTVKDSGRGIPPEVMPRVFEPFFTTKEAGKGTGLGLSTVYGIVRQSGGAIEVESPPGSGAVFRIYLPISLDFEATPAAPETHVPPARPTLLVVEDETSVRELVCEILRAEGYTVLEAADGAGALEQLASHDGEVKLLVTDVVLPRMGGPEVAERLQRERPGLKVLYMSGYSDDVRFRHGVEDASAPYLPKPFTPDALVTRVRELLDSPPGRRGP